ncbi:hypothetical protein ACVWYH_006716 [Bradyrhizobium sp. GM24.11]|jgi:hypothetical protein
MKRTNLYFRLSLVWLALLIVAGFGLVWWPA